MEFYYAKKDAKKYDKIIQNPMFEPLINLLSEHKVEGIILRVLKQEFSEPNFVRFLNELIENELICRTNRRYYVNFHIYTATDNDMLESYVKQYIAQLEPLTKEQVNANIIEILWPYCFSEAKNYFFAVREDGRSVYIKEVLSMSSLDIISLHQEKRYLNNLADYFVWLANGSKGQQFKALSILLGDVDPNYAKDQFDVILERVIKGKYKLRRPSIFYEALSQTGLVVQNEDEYSLGITQLPVIYTGIALDYLTERLNDFEYGEQIHLKSQFFHRVVHSLGFSYLEALSLHK